MMDLKNCRILVTPTSYTKNDPSLVSFLKEQVGEVVINTKGRPLTSDELIPLLEDMDGFIAGMDEIDKSVILSAKKLKVIARYGVGLNNVDLEAARQQGITVTYTPGVNASSVADLTIALILLLCRPICWASKQARQGQWPRTTGLCLDGKTIGLVGLGSIGQKVARRLSGFDCKILAYDIVQMADMGDLQNVEIVELDSLVSESDFISLHVPLTPQTKNMVDENFLKKMKKGSYLINTARGELIDDPALIDALIEGRLAGVALDAFRKEPLEKDNPLLKFPQVITTPHMGAHTDSAINAMGWGSTLDCLAVLKGEKPKYPAP